MSAAPGIEHVVGDTRPFAQCHAPTAVVGRDGEPAVAFFAGPRESHPDCAIWFARRRAGGWEAPRAIADVRRDAHWNPVLFHSADGRLHLHFKVGRRIPSWETWRSTSDDGGDTWSPPRELVPGDRGGRGAVKNKPIVLADGTILAGASLEPGRRWRVFVDRSEDGGETWQRGPDLEIDSKRLEGKGVIQPALWESKPGHVHMLMRSTFGCVCRSDSSDGGRSWSPVVPTDLPNNNSGIDVVSLRSRGAAGSPGDSGGERIVIAYNPVEENWGARSPLRLSLSEDNGRSWVRHLDLETEPGEFSYPAIVADGERLTVAYTWNRRRIAVWRGGADALCSRDRDAPGRG